MKMRGGGGGARALIAGFVISTFIAVGEWEATADVDPSPVNIGLKPLRLYALLCSYDSITEAVFTVWH